MTLTPVARLASGARRRPGTALRLGAPSGHRVGVVILARRAFAAGARSAAMHLAGAAIEACRPAAFLGFAFPVSHPPVNEPSAGAVPWRRRSRIRGQAKGRRDDRPTALSTWSAAGSSSPEDLEKA